MPPTRGVMRDGCFVFRQESFVQQEWRGKGATRNLGVRQRSTVFQHASRMLRNRKFVSHQRIFVLRDGGTELCL